ncbi:rhodanese-like domain-containing protein [Jejudonia soesokkakensis]|uniref:Rhodanese-like domain-containing protein n=1 Tax=Jejudonia soesokkakensis TaxID=1323432 RepID=A0ABW2MS51_9FLAO
MGFLDFLFGARNSKINDFKKRGGVVLDVRTQEEYDAGHIAGSKHIPLNEIPKKLKEIESWNKPIITCCLSGGRSGQAAGILNKNGIKATNGGGWASLKKKL